MNTPHTYRIFPTLATAQAIADANNDMEVDGWAYTAVAIANGKAVVQVTNEDGEKVGLL